MSLYPPPLDLYCGKKQEEPLILLVNHFIYIFLGRRLGGNTMIVAMHNHEGGEIDHVYNCIGTEDDPLHFLQLRNMFYSERKLLKCSENRTAKRNILSFVNGSYL